MNWRGTPRGSGTVLINKLARANIDEVAPVDDELIVVRDSHPSAATLRERLAESTQLRVRETSSVDQVPALLAASRARAVVLCWPGLSLADLHRTVASIRQHAEGMTLVVLDDLGCQAGRQAVALHAGADAVIALTDGDSSGLGAAILEIAERRAKTRAVGDVITVAADDAFAGRLDSGGAVAVLAIHAGNLTHLSSQGGAVGVDTVMMALAMRLRPVLRPSDIMGRTPDQCLYVVRRAADELAVAALSDRLLSACRQPIPVGDETVAIGISIGVSVRDGEQDWAAVTLLDEARSALTRARAQGQGSYLLFDEQGQARVTAQRHTEMALRHAIENHEFRVYYQPVIELATGHLASFEALMRWQRPQGGGLIYAASFFEAAQRSGLMSRIGQAILREAASEACGWPAQGIAAPALSVNLSQQEYFMPTLTASISAVLRELGLEASRLSIEIPTHLLEADTVAARSILGDLHALGVTLVADDYDGNPSEALRALPLQVVKLRMGLLAGVEADAGKRERLESIVAGARAAHWLCIGKGVENPSQAAILRDLGCHGGQGFLFSGARPAEDLKHFREAGAWTWTPRSRSSPAA